VLLPRLFSQRPLKIAKANDTATKCSNDIEPPNQWNKKDSLTVNSSRNHFGIRSIFYRSDVPLFLPKPESLQPAQFWLWPDLAEFEDQLIDSHDD
jgi:hypothetical protein